MKNKSVLIAAVAVLTLSVVSCSFFRSEKPTTNDGDSTKVDTFHVSPPDTILSTTPDSVSSK